jgi:tetratricopeptide (TPR) repeat protein
LADLHRAQTIPENLPSDMRRGGRSSEVAWWTGLAHEAMGDKAAAEKAWNAGLDPAPSGRRRGAGAGLSERQVQLYFQALARRKLGQTAEAESILRGMIEAAGRALNDVEAAEADEESGQRVTPGARRALAHYVAGLGHQGLGDKDNARTEFKRALAAAPDALGPKTELERME